MRGREGETPAPAGVVAGRYRRIEREVKPVDPVDWLASRHEAVRLFWRDRDGARAVAGAGTLAAQRVRGRGPTAVHSLFARLRDSLEGAGEEIRWFGGFAFERATRGSRGPWDEFGADCFVLPRLELVRERDRVRLAVNLRRGEEDAARDLLARAARALEARPAGPGRWAPPAIAWRRDEPDAPVWREGASAALRCIWAGDLEKIVLARRTTLTFCGPVDPMRLAGRLAVAEPDAFHFLLRPCAGAAFLCASPERLYRRDERALEAEAVAGTRPRGRGAGEDSALSRELSASEKEMREHRSVSTMVAGVMAELCLGHRELAREELVRTARVQHLRTRFAGALREGVTDPIILDRLHPTPAVAGLPREEALMGIMAFEGFDRGWYAGPVGWVARDSAEFAVAIRSALVRGDTVDLFAGAGLVLDSDPGTEWGELDDKMSVFIEILEGR